MEVQRGKVGSEGKGKRALIWPYSQHFGILLKMRMWYQGEYQIGQQLAKYSTFPTHCVVWAGLIGKKRDVLIKESCNVP